MRVYLDKLNWTSTFAPGSRPHARQCVGIYTTCTPILETWEHVTRSPYLKSQFCEVARESEDSNDDFVWPECCKHKLPILQQCRAQASIRRQPDACRFLKVEQKKKKSFLNPHLQVGIQNISCRWTTTPPAHHCIHEKINEVVASCVTLEYPKPMDCYKVKGIQREEAGRHRKKYKIH